MLHAFLRSVSKVGTSPILVGYYTTTFTSSADQTVTFGGNLTGGFASSASEGDCVLVVFAAAVSSISTNVISGFRSLLIQTSNDTYSSSLQIAAKFMTSTPDTSVTITGGSSSSLRGGVVTVYVWRNLDKNALWLKRADLATAYTKAASGNSVLANPPSVTCPASASTVIAVGAGGHNVNSQTFSSSDLTSLVNTTGDGSSSDVTLAVGAMTNKSGTVDPAAFTFSTTDSTAYSWAAGTLAFAPRPTGQPISGTIVGSTSNFLTTAGTSLSLTKPTDVIQNDILVMSIYDNGSSSRTMSSTGWTKVYSRSGSGNLSIFYKTAGASEASSYTVTSSAGANLAGIITAFRGYQWDTIGTANTTGSTSMTSNAITVGADNSWLLAVAASQSTTAISEPLTHFFNEAADTVSPSIHIMVGQPVNAGTSITPTFTMANTGANTVILFSIKPL